MPVNCVGHSSSSSSSPPASPGEVELPSRYQDMEQIGQGASCVVLRAQDSFLDRSVAIKVMKAELTDYNSVRRFQQEARMMSSFKSKHLPVVLDFGLSPTGRPFMVMELVIGLSLKQTIVERSCKLKVEQVLEITIQILSALQHAHDRGVVHRDLKSQNVMVTWTEDRQVLIKVVDFGLAGTIDQPGTITECGTALGTPYYMSPEQAQGCSADARSDLYSLGCVMFEMLTGHTPFEKGSAAATLSAHIYEKAPALRAMINIDNETLGALEVIVAKLLEKKPAKRYQTVRELKDELEGLIEKFEMQNEELCQTIDRKTSAAFTSWTNIKIVQVADVAIDESAWSEGANVSASSQNRSSQSVDWFGHSSSQLSESFASLAASKRSQNYTMVAIVVALTIILAAALISLEPALMPVSANVSPRVDSFNSVTKIEREAKAQLSENASDLTKRTFNATVGGKFHVTNADLWALPSMADNDMAMIKEFPDVKHLNLITSQSVTGVGFHQIKTLPIESIDLRSLTISQTGFDAISEMPRLKTLHVDFMPFLTVSKIRSLQAAPALETLTCRGNHLSSKLQAEIAKLPHLTKLFLGNASGLNDASMDEFATMKNLKFLSLGPKSGISRAAIERFSKLRPYVKVGL